MKLKIFLALIIPIFYILLPKPVFAADQSYTEKQIPHEFLGGGSAIGMNADDENYRYDLPFTFNFYGVGYTSVFVSTNGYICFTDDGNCSDYEVTLTTNDNSPRILVASGDLYTDNAPGEDVYITEDSEKVTFRWQAEDLSYHNPVNAEIVLYKNGDFQLNYGSNPDAFSYPYYVGMSKGDGVTYTAGYLNDQENTYGEFNNPNSFYWSKSGSGKSYNKDSRCLWSKPVEPTWIRLEKQKVGNVNGMNLTWTQQGADKMDILIDDGTGKYPWKITDTSNDGHEFLPNVTEWQNVKLFASNHCRDGSYSVPVSYSKYPYGWYNIKK